MSYDNLNFPGAIEGSKTFLTGIRRKKKDTLITGFYEVDNKYVSYVLYNNGYYIISTNYITNLYGPCFLKDDKYRFVGNIVDHNNGGELVGCYYTGRLDGKGKWKLLHSGKNTICHSTMGDLIVGNTQEQFGALNLSKAFIYDISRDKYINIEKKGSKSITAYGIWKYNNSDHDYIICGGYSPINSIHTNIGYTVRYNSKMKKFSKWKDYYYNDDPLTANVTHFNGITKSDCGGYNLTGVAIDKYTGKEIAFFLNTRKHQKNIWKEIKYPNSQMTTGNSIVDDTIIGIYKNVNDTTVNGYIVDINQ